MSAGKKHQGRPVIPLFGDRSSNKSFVRQRRTRLSFLFFLLPPALAAACLVVEYAWDGGEGATMATGVVTTGPPTGAQPVPSSSSISGGIQAAPSIEAVVEFLLPLARMSASELWVAFGMGGDDDHYNNNEQTNEQTSKQIKYPFRLDQLNLGKCPWQPGTTLDWLPPRPPGSDEISHNFRERRRAANRNQKGNDATREPKQGINNKEVVLWYEHMSKAGGTTFCALAKTNMITSIEVPKYHCMPSKEKQVDGRVGAWSNKELKDYALDNGHRILSNEWDPFPLDKLQLSGRADWLTKLVAGDDPSEQTGGPSLLFVTTMRDPSDRLLSSYNFFVHTAGKVSDNPPTLRTWMTNNSGRAHKFKPGKKEAMKSNVTRLNHITWRFSGGMLPIKPRNKDSVSELLRNSGYPLPVVDEVEWRGPFEAAVRTLALFDLILPMDVMTKNEGQEAMRRLLGWTRFESNAKNTKKNKRAAGESSSSPSGGAHIVTVGEVRNTDARSALGDEEYRILWDANWLDYLIFFWCRAVFLVRLHC